MGGKHTPTFPGLAAGQTSGRLEPIPDGNEGNALFHKHSLRSWARMPAGGQAGGKKHSPLSEAGGGKKHSPLFGLGVFSPRGKKHSHLSRLLGSFFWAQNPFLGSFWAPEPIFRVILGPGTHF